MVKIVIAASLAAIIVYNGTSTSSTSEAVEASAPQRSLKGDRLPLGPVCTQPAWPHYDTSCARSRTPDAKPAPVRQVRIVTIDRLPAAQAELADYCDCHR